MDYNARVKRLQQLVQREQIQIFLIEDPINIFYLTGIELSTGKIVVTPSEAHLIVDGRYYERCQKQSPISTHLLSARPLRSFIQEGCFVGFDVETTTYQIFQEYQTMTQQVPNASLKPVANLVKEMRAVKDPEEIDLLYQAAALGWAGFDYVYDLLEEGVTETGLAMELEIFWRRHGGKKLGFDPIIAFGANSSMPHHRASNTPLKKGDTVLIDIGVNLDHYHSDMTRVLFFGPPHEKVAEIYKIVDEAKQAALKICRPGIKIGELDQTARQLIKDRGFGEFFTHGLGHGVGLEIHELPVVRNTAPYKDVILQAGMVITIEPGIYLPNIGGVRLEDTILITNDGYDNMTGNTCKEQRGPSWNQQK